MQTIDIGLKIHLCEGKMLDTTTDNAIYIYQWGLGGMHCSVLDDMILSKEMALHQWQNTVWNQILSIRTWGYAYIEDG